MCVGGRVEEDSGGEIGDRNLFLYYDFITSQGRLLHDVGSLTFF